MAVLYSGTFKGEFWCELYNVALPEELCVVMWILGLCRGECTLPASLVDMMVVSFLVAGVPKEDFNSPVGIV
jgi:hypothetical protein